MSWPVVGLGMSIGASFLQARSTAAAARAEARVMNDQLKIDRENERIRGMQEANARQEEYLRLASSNRVAVAASGAGRSMSFEQGIDPSNKRVMGRDLETMAFNTGQRVGRISDQIRVNRWNAKSTARAAYTSAFGQSLSAVGSFLGRPGGPLE
jgi:hypothetical protein